MAGSEALHRCVWKDWHVFTSILCHIQCVLLEISEYKCVSSGEVNVAACGRLNTSEEG